MAGAVTQVTTHVLDTASGRPGAGVGVSLHARQVDGSWALLGAATTDDDGRAGSLAGAGGAGAGVHRLVFETGDYLRNRSGPVFFEDVSVTFVVDGEPHLHVPLLLSPYGYSVYRGS
jgi:5-hydroxyisourate hydrolase